MTTVGLCPVVTSGVVGLGRDSAPVENYCALWHLFHDAYPLRDVLHIYVKGVNGGDVVMYLFQLRCLASIRIATVVMLLLFLVPTTFRCNFNSRSKKKGRLLREHGSIYSADVVTSLLGYWLIFF